MKLWKISLILVAIIGISAGVYIGVSKSIENKQLEEIESYGAKTLFEFDTSTIKNATFSSNEGTFEFSTEDGSNWECTTESIRVNNSKISNALSTMSTLATTKLIEENAQNLSIYGLDNPIDVSFSDGTDTYSIQIGNTSPTGESYYIKSLENNDVYTISSDDGYLLHLTKDDLKFRYFIDSYISVVNKIIYKEGDKVIFNCQKDDTGLWNLIEPTISNVSVNISKISSIADLLIRADAIDFISENPTSEELAQYGLDNPKYTIEIADDDEDRTIYFGNSPEDNVIYAQFADTKQVATFYMGEIGIIGSGTEAVLSDLVYEDKQNNLTNLEVVNGEKYANIAIDYDEDNRSYTYTMNGKSYTEGEYYNLINYLISASLNIKLYSMDLDSVPEGEPVITVTYTRNYQPYEYKLEFIPTDEESKYYYVLMNGEYYGCMVRNRTLISEYQLLSSLDNLLNY